MTVRFRRGASDRQRARPVPQPGALGGPRTPLWIVVADADRVGQQLVEARRHGPARGRILHHEDQFVLPIAGGDVEVGAAHRAATAIHAQQLGVDVGANGAVI